MANLYLWTENTSFGTRASSSDASVGADSSVTVIKYQTDGTHDLAGVAFKITVDSGSFPTVVDSGNTYQLSDCVNQAKQGKTFAHEGQSSVQTGVPENADIYGNTSAGNKWGLCSGNAASRIITLAGVTGLQSSVNGTNILAYLYGGLYSIESILSASDSDAKSYAAESLTFQVGNPNPNSAPTDITFTAVPNLTTAHIGSIGTLATTDSDSGDTHTYTLSAADGDGTAPPFEIKNTNEVHVISTVTLIAATYSFKITTSDGNGGTYSEDFSVTISDSNAAPTDITFSAESDLKTDHTGSIGSLSTTDADSNTHTYTITKTVGGAHDVFEIKNTNEVHILSGVTLTAQEYTFKITTDDGNGGTYSENFSVTISAASTNAAPTDITFSAESDLKTDHTGSIGSLSTTDADSSDTHTYTITKTDGGAHDVFEIKNTNEVHVKSSATIAAQEYTFKITTDDGNGGTYSENFSVTFSEASGGGGGDVTQTISLNAGWNLISFYVDLDDASPSSVFSSLIDSSNLKFVSKYAGGYTSYDQGNVDNGLGFLNSLTSMSYEYGYWVQTNNSQTISVTGATVSGPLQLNAGWNLVSYYDQNEVDVSSAFSSLINNSNLKFVSKYAGGYTSYDQGNVDNGLGFLNSLTVMSPGFGYWVQTNNAVTDFYY